MIIIFILSIVAIVNLLLALYGFRGNFSPFISLSLMISGMANAITTAVILLGV